MWEVLTNKPPLTRKNVHAHTSSERPNESEMYSSWDGLTFELMAVSVAEEVGVLATLVPPMAKKRKRVVPGWGREERGEGR